MPELLALFAVVLLGAAAPPAPGSYGGLLVLPGLVLLRVLWTVPGKRGAWCSFLASGGILGWFSWSLTTNFLPGWLLMVPTAGLYGLWGRMVFRRLERWGLPGGLAFGLALAASEYVRAHMPDVHYPHGQPIHALAELPSLLRPLRIGGELFGNLILAWLVGALVDLFTSWRHGLPRWGHARVSVATVIGLWGLCLAYAPVAEGPGEGDPAPRSVRIRALESGLGPSAYWDPDWLRNRRRLQQQHVLAPTLELFRDEAALPEDRRADLILWPEAALPPEAGMLWSHAAMAGFPKATVSGLSAWPEPFVGVQLEQGRAPRRMRGFGLPGRIPEKVRLLTGGLLRHGPASRDNRIVAVLLGDDWRYLGHHEKQVAVPGGERIPLVEWLPGDLREWVFEQVEAQMGVVPSFTPGPAREPLVTARGVPFAGMTCFDGCFEWISRDAVAAGARLLTVLTNEAWFDVGGELAQMTAMMRCRAVATGTPVVRVTRDGHTMAVGADGRMLAELPVVAGARPIPPRILSVEVPTGPGALPPWAWLQRLLPWLVLGLALATWLGPPLKRLLGTRPAGVR